MWIPASINLRQIGYAVATVSCIGMGIVMSACGGSDDSNSNDDAVAMQEAPTVLTANTAGKACAADKDCGTGSCKKQLTMGGGLLGGATSVTAPGGYCSFDCRLDADCGAGGACLNANTTGGFGFGMTTPMVGGRAQPATGQCLARCDSSSQCRDGYRCLDGTGSAMESGNASPANNATGTCQVAPETDMVAAGVVGTMCASDDDCSGGSCMTTAQTTTFPGGYCTGRCLANSDCGAGAECATAFGGTGTCYKTCSADTDCSREGYRCRANAFSTNGSKRCYPGAQPLADGIVGSACTGDADCGGAAMSCITVNGMQTAPGGYCSVGCVENLDCGSGGVCIGSFGGAATGYCYKSCATTADCRKGYSCENLGFPGAGGMGGMGMAAGGTQMLACALPMTNGADGADAGM